MNFASFTFPVFLFMVFVPYWAVRGRTAQNAILVVASYVFYGWWDWRFCGLMLASTLIDYCVGRGFANTSNATRRRTLLWISIVANLGMLGLFKYAGFFVDSWIEFMAMLGFDAHPRTWSIILPVGISFYTFQTLSYTIDVYRRQIEPTRQPLEFLTFVSFFPQLVAGPIERASRLLPQFQKERQFDDAMARDGLRQILWGLIKKMVIADNLAVIVDSVYASPESHSGPVLAFATVCFAFQIYCDFSGYSDIAIGTAKLLGVRLTRNFAYPYFSQSLAEFWRRWHISLSSWFRDYVYIPLGGNRVGRLRHIANVMATFLLSGFWHGASWNFLIWGGINGAAVVPSTLYRTEGQSDVPGGERLVPSIMTLIKIAATFTLINCAWVFFRAETLSDALNIFRIVVMDIAVFSGYLTLWTDWISPQLALISLLGCMVLAEWLQRRRMHPLEIEGWPRPLRWVTYSFGTFVLIYYGTQSNGTFIYFQF